MKIEAAVCFPRHGQAIGLIRGVVTNALTAFGVTRGCVDDIRLALSESVYERHAPRTPAGRRWSAEIVDHQLAVRGQRTGALELVTAGTLAALVRLVLVAGGRRLAGQCARDLGLRVFGEAYAGVDRRWDRMAPWSATRRSVWLR